MSKVCDEVIVEMKKLLSLIEKERNEEFVFYSQYLAKLPIQQKVKEGYSWYPVIIKDTGFGFGDYPYVKIESKMANIQGHQFSGGKQVKLYNSTNSKEFAVGSVYYVDGNSMKVSFILDSLPDWIEDSKIAIDVLFDEKTYKEMEKAIKKVMVAENSRLAELANILYGFAQTEPVLSKNAYKNEKLNQSQNEAVNSIIETNDIALIHGPPGTGKTTTLIAAIQEMTKRGEKVLVCTPSNASADHIAIGLGHKKINIVRIGNLSKVSNDLLKYTVDGMLEKHYQQKELFDYRRRSLEYRRMAAKYKRNFGADERQQRDLLYKEARALSNEARALEDYMVSSILNNADVVVTTLVGVESKYLEKQKFKTVIIDEAAQALEPATWIPICRAEKIIMAGDPFQLPPTVKSAEALKNGLGFTLMEKCMKTQPLKTHLLAVQYRMNADIMEFSNNKFYNNKLIADPSVANRKLEIPNTNNNSVEFIDTAGCGFEENKDLESSSLYNEGEIKIILQHIEQWVVALNETTPTTIAIISPYRQQVKKINEYLQAKGGIYNTIKVNTVDSFQGQEQDIIYISLVRSNNNGDIGFLKDYRRMNVALTRAKKKLVVIGDSATLCNDSFYSDFISFVDLKKYYKTAWEYLYSA